MAKDVKYKVVCKTSKDYKLGATDADIFIMMIGNNGTSTSSWVKLDNFLWDDFELGQTDKFDINSKDVGKPEVIRLRIERHKDYNGWLCDWVKVKHPTEGEVFFSVYDVVMDSIAVRCGDASLPQNDKSLLYRDIRRIEVQRNRGIYQWHVIPAIDEVGWDLPRFCEAETHDQLPLLFRANDVLKDNFDSNQEKAFYNILFETISGFFVDGSIKELEDYREIFHCDIIPSDPPPFIGRWESDEEFGRQVLSGVNPLTIKRCIGGIPAEFKGLEAEIFGNKETYNKLLKENRLYFISYRGALDGLRRNKNKQGDQLYCTDSICLFKVDEDDELRPVAIQLEKDGDVFTPHDGRYDWLLAKMYFRNTDTNIHEFQYHLLRTHILIEPIGIALFQTLARTHPLYKLLRPHLHTVASINTLGRTFLIGNDATANLTLSMNGLDTTRAAFRAVTYDDLIIENVLKKNGTDNPKHLPNYNYREDARRIWGSIERYVKNIVCHYYKNNQDVVDDYELKEFVRVVAFEGIGWAGNGTKGFPTEITTIEKLIEYCTMIIFTSSAQHAASNFGQFDIYKFIPNSPAGMRMRPHKKGEGSEKRMLDSLPDTLMACVQVGISHALSSFAPNELFLGNYPLKLFTEENVQNIQEEFRRDLVRISKEIKERNAKLVLPYTYLLPECIPNSIAV